MTMKKSSLKVSRKESKTHHVKKGFKIKDEEEEKKEKEFKEKADEHD